MHNNRILHHIFNGCSTKSFLMYLSFACFSRPYNVLRKNDASQCQVHLQCHRSTDNSDNPPRAVIHCTELLIDQSPRSCMFASVTSFCKHPRIICFQNSANICNIFVTKSSVVVIWVSLARSAIFNLHNQQ